MPTYAYLTLLTDYGLDDGFVAACHGVAAQAAPEIRVIDVTHLVPPGDVRRAGAVLAQTALYLPPAVHVVVVDPGVGTTRRAVVVEAGESLLVGPDNGVLSWPATALGGAGRVHELTNRDLWIHPVSATFHGRDIFTPVAARLAAGVELAEVGPALTPDQLEVLPEPVSHVAGGHAETEVVSVDHFGNVALSLTADQLRQLGVGGEITLELAGGRTIVPYGQTFASVPPGELVAYTDSTGYIAVAVNGGSAARRLDLQPGTSLRVTPA